MTFKIGDSHVRPTTAVTNGKKPEIKKEAESAAPQKGGFDTASFRKGPLAVMPRMSSVTSHASQEAQGKTVETLLKDSAAELDDFFTKGYGFSE